MGRRQVFTEQAIIDAARALAASGGPNSATMNGLAKHLCAPVGSLYHRFPSRAALLARVWLETVALFQGALLRGLRDAAAPVGEIARQTVLFCEANPEHARLLVVHRAEDFLGRDIPPSFSEWARDLGEQLHEGLRRFARERLWSVSTAAIRRVTLAVIDIPYAAVRPHLVHGERIPRVLEDWVARAADAVFPLRDEGEGAV
jgi:AcrR family transcriptional regulator